MLNCDRCGLYAKGQSSIYEFNLFEEENRKDYESLEETHRDTKKKYSIISGHNSDYDDFNIELTGNIQTQEECLEKHPWITNIGDQFDNLCDDCIKKMLINKEAIPSANDMLVIPFYTSCCDKLIMDVPDAKLFYEIRKINLFPYFTYLKCISCYDINEMYANNSDTISFDIPYIKEEDALFILPNGYSQCTICRDCLVKNSAFTNIKCVENFAFVEDMEIKDHPCFYTLRQLRYRCEIYLNWDDRKKNITLTSYGTCISKIQIPQYKNWYYFYMSKKNNLLLMRELSYFFARRNLSILRNYFPISNDAISLILKYF
jgi:hypothetical protein